MRDDYRKGFADQTKEIIAPSLNVEGIIPDWLSGTLLRNGPARFGLEDKTLNHWFDGLAMLHRFHIANGRVSYANKFLDSPAFRAAEDGKMQYAEFATDPCRSLFKRIAQVFTGSAPGANANVSIGKIAGRFVAQTEGPVPIAFDEETLKTIGIVSYGDTLKGQLTTAHPHYDHGSQFNYLLNFGRQSTYNIYTLPDGSSERRLVGSYQTDRPSYMHSFGLSQKYVVLMEFPLVVNPLSMLLRGKPFIANYTWQPQRGTRFSLVDRDTGEVSHAHTDEAWFGFHHVNSADRDGKIDFDMIVYPDADVVQYFYLNSLLNRPNHEVYPQNELRRFTIDVSAGTVSSRRLADYSGELPRINYERCNGQTYQYVYAAGLTKGGESAIFDSVVKFDLAGDVREWKQEDQYPGEPVFVARPDAQLEDEGILLSVVLDAPANNSYLLLLDARDLSEVARATVPQHVPFGFHGAYVRS
ncbi:carotenoid cleavage dioxygenase-like enzyme [Nitrosospira sp. Nsp2]|uniref:carotenoid oxygenase family protein n=1 Tax=Nitrosospira sp. Nsp2 TaxID=136548 RepID=UPI000D31033D|nr:carotenoid oxygenase family protein [Nitrosospira sp. Nsp2]PTR16084.1 carotenoid cleavage dioxygenase-like enzyme [Nitrosospira sp. Nsp2]